MNIPELEIYLLDNPFADVTLSASGVEWLEEKGYTIYCVRNNYYRVFRRNFE